MVPIYFVCYVRNCDATGLSMNVLLKAIHDKMESNECTVKCDSKACLSIKAEWIYHIFYL